MVYACYCIYNEEQFLRQSLQSIIDFVEKVIIIDGVWSTYPSNAYASTDKSKKIAQEVCGDKLIWVDAPDGGWRTQVEKRTQYLNLVPDGEWLFVIDGDEILHGDIKAQFKKIERNKSLHICLVEVSFHVPYINGKYYNRLNGVGGYADTTNRNASVFLQSINSEKKFKKMQWLALRGHRYAMYKKEPNMHYGQHHSILWVGDKSIFDCYGAINSPNEIGNKSAIYLLQNVIINDLKYLREYNRWKSNMVDKTKRIISDTLERD